MKDDKRDKFLLRLTKKNLKTNCLPPTFLPLTVNEKKKSGENIESINGAKILGSLVIAHLWR